MTIHHKRISGTFFDLILSQKHVDVVKLACCLELPTGQGVTSATTCWKLFFHEAPPFFDGNLPDEKYSCRFLHLRRVMSIFFCDTVIDNIYSVLYKIFYKSLCISINKLYFITIYILKSILLAIFCRNYV